MQPDDAVAHHNLGNALAAAGDLEAAAASYRHASEAMTDDGHALLQYVQVSKSKCAPGASAPYSEAVLQRASRWQAEWVTLSHPRHRR